MRYALVSDITRISPPRSCARGIANVLTSREYHLGDMVGYGPWPNEVVSILRSREVPVSPVTMTPQWNRLQALRLPL